MIPDLYWSAIHLGPITLQVWGLFVAAGIITGLFVAKHLAKQRGLSSEVVVDMAFWVVLAALIGSRVFYVVTEWSEYVDNLVGVVKVWEGGMSVSGGLLSAIAAAVIFLRVKKQPLLPYLELLAYAFPAGLAVGRLGCFFIFDHPGTVTNFFLGEVYYADGLVRHNHGLYLALDGAILFTVFFILNKRFKLKPPFFIAFYMVWEGIMRLWLDSFRILDARYWNLTGAQWTGVIMLIVGVGLFVKYRPTPLPAR